MDFRGVYLSRRGVLEGVCVWGGGCCKEQPGDLAFMCSIRHIVQTLYLQRQTSSKARKFNAIAPETTALGRKVLTFSWRNAAGSS